MAPLLFLASLALLAAAVVTATRGDWQAALLLSGVALLMHGRSRETEP